MDVQGQLIEWARWRSTGSDLGIGYPAESAFVRMMKPPGYRVSQTAIMSDEAGMMVDRAVAMLYQRCHGVDGDYRYEALSDCYLLGKTDSFIARRLKCGRGTIKSARQAAESWVESHMMVIND